MVVMSPQINQMCVQSWTWVDYNNHQFKRENNSQSLLVGGVQHSYRVLGLKTQPVGFYSEVVLIMERWVMLKIT